jgi:dihydrofolate synthase/folylpolyglutamate synthase
LSRASAELEAALKRFETLYPNKIDLSLERITAVLETLGRPQDKLPPVIHVAGTNGKGSTCAFMRAMAEAAGLKTHVAISPHLVRFNERVRLAGKLVEDQPMIGWLDRVYAAVGPSGQITHFEAAMTAAFLAFSEIEADLLILETGLGGRFDASNVVDRPAVSVITPVDYDHKAYLGNDLSRIAWEKAGIIKQGCPVVSAQQSFVPSGVIAEEAFALNAPLTVLTPADIENAPKERALIGWHQAENAALAAKALGVWGDKRVTASAIEEGARRAVWPGRMQKLEAGPVTAFSPGKKVWLDGGHNPHAARAVAAYLESLPGETVLISAMMAGKDAVGFFKSFSRLNCKVITCPNAGGHNGADPALLAEAALEAGLEAVACQTFKGAMQIANLTTTLRILICGSLYLAGDVLALNEQLPD